MWTWKEYVNYPKDSWFVYFYEDTNYVATKPLTHISLGNLYDGLWLDFGFLLEFDQKSLANRERQSLNEPANYYDIKREDRPGSYYSVSPKCTGFRSDAHVLLADYYPIKSDSNYVKLDYVSKDTIMGNFQCKLKVNRTKSWLQMNNDVDTMYTFKVDTFIAAKRKY
jgi:hypothetical protein